MSSPLKSVTRQLFWLQARSLGGVSGELGFRPCGWQAGGLLDFPAPSSCPFTAGRRGRCIFGRKGTIEVTFLAPGKCHAPQGGASSCLGAVPPAPFPPWALCSVPHCSPSLDSRLPTLRACCLTPCRPSHYLRGLPSAHPDRAQASRSCVWPCPWPLLPRPSWRFPLALRQAGCSLGKWDTVPSWAFPLGC